MFFECCSVVVSYELNKEKVTQGRSGAKRCTVTLRDEGRMDGIVITTTMPTVQGQMHLIETRRLLEKGKSHSQVSLGWALQHGLSIVAINRPSGIGVN